MNKEFIQINDNEGTVIDQKGNFKVVKKENNSANFETILALQNQLEDAENQIYDAKGRINGIEVDNKLAKECDIGLLIIVPVMVFGLLYLFKIEAPFLPKLMSSLVLLSFGKLLSLYMFKSKRKRNKELKKMNEIIEEFENKKPELKRQLEYAKEKTRYSEYAVSRNDSILNNYAFSNSNDTTLKVLRLDKR